MLLVLWLLKAHLTLISFSLIPIHNYYVLPICTNSLYLVIGDGICCCGRVIPSHLTAVKRYVPLAIVCSCCCSWGETCISLPLPIVGIGVCMHAAVAI